MFDEEAMNQICNRLKNHPEMLETLDITGGVNGIEIADEAEFALIPEVRGLGKKMSRRLGKTANARERGISAKEKAKAVFKKKSIGIRPLEK